MTQLRSQIQEVEHSKNEAELKVTVQWRKAAEIMEQLRQDLLTAKRLHTAWQDLLTAKARQCGGRAIATTADTDAAHARERREGLSKGQQRIFLDAFSFTTAKANATKRP